MPYSPELIHDLQADAARLAGELQALTLRLFTETVPALRVPKAREYLLHGVCRRLDTLRRSLVRVFELFPVDQARPLEDDARSLVEASVQVFLLNLFGVLDNAAWVLLLEHNVTIKKTDVGLFLKRTQAHLAPELSQVLTDSKLASWFANYVKPYRDALAHRIPLYVPPYGVRESKRQQDEDLDVAIRQAVATGDLSRLEQLEAEQLLLQEALPVFVHSHDPDEGAKPMLLHPQMIVDVKTALLILAAAFPPKS